jgi:hypothetical protein
MHLEEINDVCCLVLYFTEHDESITVHVHEQNRRLSKQTILRIKECDIKISQVVNNSRQQLEL